VIFVDDILVFSQRVVDHPHHLRATLQALAGKNFKVSIKKTTLAASRMGFLGHVIYPGRIETDPEKVKAITSWPRPESLQQLRRFLGTINYYRDFVADISRIASPLYAKSRTKDFKTWTAEEVAAFETLKHRLATSRALATFDSGRETQVQVDASAAGCGAVLTQFDPGANVWKVVAFFSRRYTPTQSVLPARDLELLGLFLAVTHWRAYLHCRPFHAITDHYSSAAIG